MTKVQELQVRQSEVRQKLNELLGVETRTAEQQTELEAVWPQRCRSSSPRLRAAIAAEPNPEVRTTATDDPETRERNALARDARVGEFIAHGRSIARRSRRARGGGSGRVRVSRHAPAGALRRRPAAGDRDARCHARCDSATDRGADRAVRVHALGRGVSRVHVPDGTWPCSGHAALPCIFPHESCRYPRLERRLQAGRCDIGHDRSIRLTAIPPATRRRLRIEVEQNSPGLDGQGRRQRRLPGAALRRKKRDYPHEI